MTGRKSALLHQKAKGAGIIPRPFPFIQLSRCLGFGTTVTQQLTWRLARASAFLEGLDAVDDNRAISMRALYPAPFAAWQVMNDFANPFRIGRQALQAINHDVGPRSFT